MNEVHRVSKILQHASVGHKQVAVLETFLKAEIIVTAEKEFDKGFTS